MVIARVKRSRISRRSFIFLPMRAKMFRILPTRGTFCAAHDPRPSLSFSFSTYGLWLLNRGRLLDIRRMCRVKKPWFWVEKDGYPFIPTVLILLSQGVEAPLDAEKPLLGLDRPLVLMVRPGLAQPPPGIGEGLRESDIAVFGVPVAMKEHELSASGSRRSVVQHVFTSVACRYTRGWET